MTARDVMTAEADPASPRLAKRWVLERFPAYGRASAVIGVFLAPLAFYRGAYGTFSVPKMTVLWFTALAAVAFWAAALVEGRATVPFFRLGAAAVAFVGASAIATIFSLSPRLSLVGAFERYGGLIPRIVFVTIMFAVVALFWERPERLRWIAIAIGASSAALAGSVLLQQAGVDRALWPGPVTGTLYDYPIGTVGHSNFAGAHLGLALPCLWYLFKTSARRLDRSFIASAFALDLVALWFTQSRSGMLAAAVGLGVAVILSRDHLGPWLRAGLAGTSVMVVAVGVVIVWHPGADAPPPRLAGSQALRTKTLQFRLAYWEAAAHIFLDHPIVGTGLDTFYAYYPRYRSSPDDVALDAVTRTDKPHNIILEHASSSGVLGLGSYLTVVTLAATYGIRRTRQLQGTERHLLACFVGLFAGYLAQGFFSIDLPDLAVMGWVAVGAIAVLADPAVIARRALMAGLPRSGRADRSSGETTPRHATSRRSLAGYLVHAAVLTAVVSLSFVGLRPLRASVAFNEDRVEDALRLDPLNAEYLLQAGRTSEFAGAASRDDTQKRRLFDAAEDIYLKALRLQPGDTYVTVRMANLQTLWAAELDPGRFAGADTWWRRAVAADPQNQTTRTNYVTDFPAVERRAVARLEADTQVEPNDAGARVVLAEVYLAIGETAKARASLEDALRLDPGNAEAQRRHATTGP